MNSTSCFSATRYRAWKPLGRNVSRLRAYNIHLLDIATGVRHYQCRDDRPPRSRNCRHRQRCRPPSPEGYRASSPVLVLPGILTKRKEQPSISELILSFEKTSMVVPLGQCGPSRTNACTYSLCSCCCIAIRRPCDGDCHVIRTAAKPSSSNLFTWA